jgi:hypothetical protein
MYDVFVTSGSRSCITQCYISSSKSPVKSQGRLHPDRAPDRSELPNLASDGSPGTYRPYQASPSLFHIVFRKAAELTVSQFTCSLTILAPSGVYCVEQNRPPLHFIVLGQYASFLWCHMTLGVLRRRRLFEEVLFTRENPRRNCAIGTQWRLPPQARG